MKAIPFSHTEILAEIIAPLLTWYRAQSEERALPWRGTEDPYRVWLSEIMLQQTRATTVIPYYERFLGELPTIEALAAVGEDTLMKLWQGLGYYSRARNLKRAAELLVREHGGKLPRDHKALLTLPGIGPYTGAAIASIAFGLPLPAVDGNVLRVVCRVLEISADIAEMSVRRAIADALAPHYPGGKDAGDLNQAFMDLGATVCLPNGAPHCPRCPLNRLCLAHASGTEEKLPVKSRAKARRIEERTVLRLEQGCAIGIQKRPKKGLLAGLWELPSLNGKKTLEDVKAYLKKQGLSPAQITELPPAKHIFSHVEWHMTAYCVQLEGEAETVAEGTPYTWATKKALATTYSIPSAFSYFL